MASPLDTLAAKVAAGFKGKLSVGTLRREVPAALNEYGDPVPVTPDTYPFEGIRDTFSFAFASGAGIPLTDVKILIIAKSITVDPIAGDKVFIRTTSASTGAWYEIRAVLARDPANATHILAGFSIPDPDA